MIINIYNTRAFLDEYAARRAALRVTADQLREMEALLVEGLSIRDCPDAADSLFQIIVKAFFGQIDDKLLGKVQLLQQGHHGLHIPLEYLKLCEFAIASIHTHMFPERDKREENTEVYLKTARQFSVRVDHAWPEITV